MIPFVDLQAQYRALKPEIDAAVLKVLDQAAFILGPAVAAFEKDFAAFCGTTEAVGVNSGTSALHLALLAAGVGPADEVITVPYTFVATVAAIEYAGAKPVLVDVEPDYWTMDPAKLEAAITPRTKAIMPVHLYGQPADMDPILEIARRRGIPVIEDAAQAHASEYKGRRCGSMGLLGCFSFYPGKNLGAYGEGGAVVTSDLLPALRITEAEFDRMVARERVELERRVERYRAGRVLPSVHGRDVVLVDDGLATGVTAEAALRALRAEGPRRLVLAVPVSSPDTAARLQPPADEVVTVVSTRDLVAVGVWYEDFRQTTDEEVIALLGRGARG